MGLNGINMDPVRGAGGMAAGPLQSPMMTINNFGNQAMGQPPGNLAENIGRGLERAGEVAKPVLKIGIDTALGCAGTLLNCAQGLVGSALSLNIVGAASSVFCCATGLAGVGLSSAGRLADTLLG